MLKASARAVAAWSRGSRLALAFVVVTALVAAVQLPATLLPDVRGARDNLARSPSEAADLRGPSASAGTNLALVHAALARIPSGESFSIVRGGRWGTAQAPNRARAFVWQAGQAWTQFALAPRVEVAPRDASWMLIRDATPAEAGVAAPVGAWRYGTDWLVKVR